MVITLDYSRRRKVKMKLPNLPAYRKTIAAVITGVLGWAAVVITSEPTAIIASEWLMLATVTATAIGVYQTPNEKM